MNLHDRPDTSQREFSCSGLQEPIRLLTESKGREVCTDGQNDILEFKVNGWNVGGCEINDLEQHFRDGCECSLSADSLLTLQEIPRDKAGWSKQVHGAWTVVCHRAVQMWRRVGIGYRDSEWALLRRVWSGRGVWVQLKHLSSDVRVWVGTAHFTPGCSLAQYEGEVEECLHGLPAHTGPTVFQCDANAPFHWGLCDGIVSPAGRDVKANALHGMPLHKGLEMVPPMREYMNTPTSRPRQEGRNGHIIDMLACKRVVRGQVTVYIDSSKVLGTDHEIISSSFHVRAKRVHQRHSTKPRVWTGGCQGLSHVDQDTPMQLARTCTKPKPGHAYKDPPEVKHAARRARVCKTQAAWKEVRKLRKQARRLWGQQRVLRATSGDWAAFRTCKPQADSAWVEGFAATQEGDPHQAVHDHLTQVYTGTPPLPNQGPPVGEVQGFTEEELDRALEQMQPGKSVGSDGTSKELLLGICGLDGGKSLLLEFLTRVLTTQEIPEQWNVPLMILLPKLTQPLVPKDLRPISMSSAISKLFSRLLLNRCLTRLSLSTHAQCSGPGRQTSDYVFAIWRVLELEREWHRGLCVAKLDISKAFDTVSKERVLGKLQQRLGDTPEMRCWRGLLQQNYGILQSPWGVSRVRMQQGIKQGSVESPHLFALIAELCLAETAERYKWRPTTSF